MLAAQQILNGRYQLQRKLGERPARQTWLAQDLESNLTVVIKLLVFGGQVQWDDLKLFEREAQILQELDHPLIPKYCDYFSIDDRFLCFALVEQYIPGSSLQNLLDIGNRFSESEVKDITLKLLDILYYLHQLNPQVLHRDIKPSNIILGEDKQVYLVDFGAVQDKAAAEGASFTIVGTYGYTPMEQFGGRAVAASDLYALGATLIHLLTGTSPADLPQKDLQIQLRGRVKISQHFTNWLEKITEPALENRFKSASQAQKALKSSSNLTRNKYTDSQLISNKFELFKNDNELNLIFDFFNSFSIRTIKKVRRSEIFLLSLSIFVVFTSSILTLPLIRDIGIVLALISTLIILCSQFFHKYIYFEKGKIKIKFAWFIDQTLKVKKYCISDIKNIYCENTYSSLKNRQQAIIVQFNGKKIKLAQNLTKAEADWLLQEIDDWLNIE